MPRQVLQDAHDTDCPYCRQRMSLWGDRRFRPTRDHLHPKATRSVAFTGNGINEILVCCAGCNQDKGCKSIERWHEVLVNAQDRRSVYVGQIIDLQDNAGGGKHSLHRSLAQLMKTAEKDDNHGKSF